MRHPRSCGPSRCPLGLASPDQRGGGQWCTWLDVEGHGRGLRRPDARPARGHGGVAPAGRCGCANVGLLMGRPVTMCGGLWTSAFWPVRMRAVRREVVRVGRDAWRLGGAASPGKTPWFGCTVGMQLRTGFSRRKSRRLLVGGDDDGIRGCRSPYWGVILELIPFARIPLGENLVHLLDGRRRHL